MASIYALQNTEEGCQAFTPKGWIHYPCDAMDLLEKWCISCGSSVQGRIDSYHVLTRHKMKAPILISEKIQLIYFPTASMKNESCIWISYTDIFQIKKTGEMETMIQFRDGNVMHVPFNIRLIRGQMRRCQEYLDAIYQSSQSFLEMMDVRPGLDMIHNILGGNNES